MRCIERKAPAPPSPTPCPYLRCPCSKNLPVKGPGIEGVIPDVDMSTDHEKEGRSLAKGKVSLSGVGVSGRRILGVEASRNLDDLPEA